MAPTGQIDDTGLRQALEAVNILIDVLGDQTALQLQRSDAPLHRPISDCAALTPHLMTRLVKI
jgi:hypothetical protein